MKKSKEKRTWAVITGDRVCLDFTGQLAIYASYLQAKITSTRWNKLNSLKANPYWVAEVEILECKPRPKGKGRAK